MNRSPHNRRRASRLEPHEDHGIVSVRIRPGHAARIVDVSASGVLLETAHRLLPGTVVDLHVERPHHERASIRGRVVRCTVAGVRATSLSYRGAIAFDRQLPWLAAAGCAIHNAEPRAAASHRAPATHVAV
jgi:hypothetical protein